MWFTEADPKAEKGEGGRGESWGSGQLTEKTKGKLEENRDRKAGCAIIGVPIRKSLTHLCLNFSIGPTPQWPISRMYR